MQATYVIREERDRLLALKAVQRAPVGRQVRISKPDRTLEQNNLLHGSLTDIAKQLAWPPPPRNDGELHDVVWWKRRVTLGWLIDTGQEYEIIESLDGLTFALLLPHTSDLKVDAYASLNEWVFAFGATNGVTFKAPGGPEPPPPNPDDYR